MFLFSQTHRTASGAHSSFFSMSTVCSFSGLMRPEHETDHSPQFNAKVQNNWSCDCTPSTRNRSEQGQSYTYCAYHRHQIKPDRYCKQRFMISSHNMIANCPDYNIYFNPLDHQLNTTNLDDPHNVILTTHLSFLCGRNFKLLLMCDEQEPSGVMKL